MKELIKLFLTFAKIGAVTFGGGYAMLPILQRDIVEKHKWATEDELLDYFAIGQCTPGVIAVNTATFVGYKTKGILGGIFCCIFFLKAYLKKLQQAPKKEENGEKKKPGFGAHATTAMFIGLCGTFIGAYVGKAIPREGSDVMPLLVAIMAAAVMSVFEYFIQKKGKAVLENFSLAASMLVAMAGAVLIGLL